MDLGSPIETTDNSRCRAIHRAVYERHDSVVELLLQRGASVLGRGESHTPLWLAAQRGSVSCCKLLLDAGAPVDDDSISTMTPLGTAADNMHPDVVTLLLSHSADPNLGQPLIAALGGGCHPAVVNLLVHAGADINCPEPNAGWTPIIYAALNGEVGVMKLLLEVGADIHAKTRIDGRDDDGGRTALHWAAAKGKKIVLRMLVEAGADIEAVDESGMTPMALAHINDQDECVQRLRDAGARF